MTLNLTIPQQNHTDFTPRITVIGVGGGGTNAVNTMISLGLQGVEFVVANTDAQSLMNSAATRRVQLGPHITQGLGAGAKPEIGHAAAEEAAEELYRHLDGAHMVFITAGMGGGTGTGAAPVIARMARERNILTVGVVSKPFDFEGKRRARAADQGIDELQKFVDTLIVIPNQNLFRIATERTTWQEAFKMADNVLYMGVRGVTDLMMTPGMVNLDFADIRSVMAEMGKAMMGTGEGEGENRAVRAAELAISNPLLEDTNMSGARGLLINITGGEDMTLFEVDQAANRIREEVDEEANIIFGTAIDERLNGKMRVSVVATGIDLAARQEAQRPRLVAMGGGAPMQQGPQIGGQPGAQPSHNPYSQQPMTQALHPSHPVLAPHSAPGAPVLAPNFGNTAQAGGQHYGHQPMAGAVPLRAPEAEEPPLQLTAAQATHGAQPLVAQSGAHGGGALGQLRAAPRGGLFSPDPEAVMSGHPPMHAPEPPRRNIFQAVTGRLRNTLSAATMPPQADHGRGEPIPEEQHQPQHQEPRASVRHAASEEMGLEIPAFLRRQNS